MRAVLSGRAAVALLNDGDDWHSIHYEDLDCLVPRQKGDFAHLFHEARDLHWLDETDLQEVRDELEDAVDATEGLDLVLDLLNPRLSDNVRDAAVLEVEEIVPDESVTIRIENVILAAPFPDNVDLDGAYNACRRTGCEAVRMLLNDWLNLQEGVCECHRAWLQISDTSFGSSEDRERCRGELVRYGVFRTIARWRTHPARKGVNTARELSEIPGVEAFRETITLLLKEIERVDPGMQEPSARHQPNVVLPPHESLFTPHAVSWPVTRVSLVMRLKSRTIGAWDEFVDLYSPLIMRFCLRRELSRQEAESVLLHSFKRIANEIVSFEYSDKAIRFGDWIGGIVNDECRNQLNLEVQSQQSFSIRPTSNLCDIEAGSRWGDEFRAWAAERALFQLQKTLPEIQWKCFIESWRTNDKPRVVASRLGVNPDVVFKTLYKVTPMLKILVDKIMNDGSFG